MSIKNKESINYKFILWGPIIVIMFITLITPINFLFAGASFDSQSLINTNFYNFDSFFYFFGSNFISINSFSNNIYYNFYYNSNSKFNYKNENFYNLNSNDSCINTITPGTQKAVYLTGYYSIGKKDVRERIYKLIDNTELNAIVFDVKDDAGYIDYNCSIKQVVESGAVKSYYNLDEILKELRERNIYCIVRFVAFKDNVLPRAKPEFAVLNKITKNPAILEGSTWVDIYCEQAWDYYIEIIKDLALRGVDEIQFDYLRAPSRGNIKNAEYPHNSDGHDKVWAISNFLKKVREETACFDIKISADVFGWVFIEKNDQGIGQLIEEMAPYLDYIYPMAYPSHYNIHFLGFDDAEAHPYEVVRHTLEKGFERIGDTECRIIPWIQAFSYDLKYTETEILDQIRAAEDLNIQGFLFWNAANKYSAVERALYLRVDSNNSQ